MTLSLLDIRSNSSRILLIQIASSVVHDVDLYFAFEDDKVFVSCFFEVEAATHDPNLNTYPLVLFLSSHATAQSLSEYPTKLNFEHWDNVFQDAKFHKYT